jgi:MoxR-like ATPase
MFNVWLDYPTLAEEIKVVKNTTSDIKIELDKIINEQEIVYFQDLIRKIPIADNVLEYAVKLATKTRPNTDLATTEVNKYLSWGAGPRASQFLVLGAKCNAVFNGKYSPDIEDVKAVATSILRHRIVRNYKAEADGISVEDIINSLLK